jgi:hypothetical protein
MAVEVASRVAAGREHRRKGNSPVLVQGVLESGKIHPGWIDRRSARPEVGVTIEYGLELANILLATS